MTKLASDDTHWILTATYGQIFTHVVKSLALSQYVGHDLVMRKPLHTTNCGRGICVHTCHQLYKVNATAQPPPACLVQLVQGRLLALTQWSSLASLLHLSQVVMLPAKQCSMSRTMLHCDVDNNMFSKCLSG